MADVRKRKVGSKIRSSELRSKSNSSHHDNDKDTSSALDGIFNNIILGVIMMSVCGYAHAWISYTVHENLMWFTNIKEVEREISFRTESGLYYSYYKQMVHAPSIVQGISDLMNDNQTEHPSTINVLARMNIYQEVVLAIIYRVLGIKMLPILFYIICIFSLHAILVAALFASAWILSGTWLAGILTAAFYVVNRIDTTRIGYTIPLRESFSLPFLWVQVLAITIYFQPRGMSVLKKRVLLSVIAVSTFLFTVCWQFNQFIFLLQVSSLFGVWVLGLIPGDKIRNILHIILASMMAVCVLQFINQMILVSMGLNLVLAMYIVMYIKGEPREAPGVLMGLMKTVLYSVLVLVLAGALTAVMKFLLRVDADDHIFKFLAQKFGEVNNRDFDARMYLCLGAFNFLTLDTYTRLTEGLVFPPYALCHIVLLVILAIAALQNFRKPTLPPKLTSDKKAHATSNGKANNNEGELPKQQHILSSRPELAFLTIQTLVFGLLAISTLRMKFFWTPYMCVFGSLALCDLQMWRVIASRFKMSGFMMDLLRNSALIVVLAGLFAKEYSNLHTELNTFREFWDPDTVELMEWMKKDIPKTSSFTGSMQLLAGVKLCGERPITNHPHYEDKSLRIKTKELYQIYGRRKPEDVHSILRKHKSNYIILEDSICRAQSTGCRVPDLVDYDNGVVPDHGEAEEGLEFSSIPRFCEHIRNDPPEYTKYFKKVFENKTFRVHEVLDVPS